MKNLKAILFAGVFCLSIFLTGNLPVQAAGSPANSPNQIVPKTKRVSHRVYRKGHYVTKTVWVHGKKISKKVWVKGKWIGRKVADKTHDIVMGKKHPTP